MDCMCMRGGYRPLDCAVLQIAMKSAAEPALKQKGIEEG